MEHPKRHLAPYLEEDMHILPSDSLISRRAFEFVGGFGKRLSGYEGDDLFLHLFVPAGFDRATLRQGRVKQLSRRHLRDCA
jgi:hypothetical protein